MARRLLDLVREDIRLGQMEMALRDLEALDRKLQEAQREIAFWSAYPYGRR